MAEASPDTYLPYLATSLVNLSLRLRDMGRLDESLAAKRRAIAVQQRLADARPVGDLPELEAPLNKLSMESNGCAAQPSDADMDIHGRSPAPEAEPGAGECDWPTCKFFPSSDAEVGMYRGWCWRHGRYRACYFHRSARPACPRCGYRRKLRAERGRVGASTTDVRPAIPVSMALVPEIHAGTRLVIAMTNKAAPGSFYAEVERITYEPFLGVISATPKRCIAWVDYNSGAPRQLGTAETTRLYLGDSTWPIPTATAAARASGSRGRLRPTTGPSPAR